MAVLGNSLKEYSQSLTDHHWKTCMFGLRIKVSETNLNARAVTKLTIDLFSSHARTFCSTCEWKI